MLPWRSDLSRGQLELIFSQFNILGLRLAPNQDAIYLDTARPKRAAQFDNSPAQAPGEANLDAITEVEAQSRPFRLLLGH